MGACLAALRGDNASAECKRRARAAGAPLPTNPRSGRRRATKALGAVGAFRVRRRNEGREKGHDIAALLRDRRPSIQI